MPQEATERMAEFLAKEGLAWSCLESDSYDRCQHPACYRETAARLEGVVEFLRQKGSPHLASIQARYARGAREELAAHEARRAAEARQRQIGELLAKEGLTWACLDTYDRCRHPSCYQSHPEWLAQAIPLLKAKGSPHLALVQAEYRSLTGRELPPVPGSSKRRSR